MDKKSNQNFYNPFKADYTLADLEKRFQIEEQMGIEFKKFPKRLLKGDLI